MATARETHRLIEAASSRGGVWISAAGGTALKAAGEIARRLGVPFEDAFHALDATHPKRTTDQYYLYWFYWNQGYEYPRFSIECVVSAAVKAAEIKLSQEWERAASIAEAVRFCD